MLNLTYIYVYSFNREL